MTTPNSREVVIPGAVELRGTLTLPPETQNENGSTCRRPAVLIVPGSGEVDRDGNARRLAIPINIYSDLAVLLTEMGLVTLRYDKRGVGESGGEFLSTGMWDLVDDIEACMRFLQAQPEVDPDRVWGLGHSEGCILLSIYAASHPLAGLIMLAGAGDSIAEATAHQRRVAYAELMSGSGFQSWLARLLRVDVRGERQAQTLLDRVRRSEGDTIRLGFQRLNAKWLREHLAYDPEPDLRRLNCPVLAVTGSRDLQADHTRLERVQETLGSLATTKVIEGMSHFLKECGGEPILQIRKMLRNNLAKPLHPQLAVVLKSWFESQWASDVHTEDARRAG